MTDHYIRTALLPAISLICLVSLLGACEGGRLPLAGQALSADNDRPPRAAEAWEQPVPQAVCGSDDPVETGLQGQVPRADRDSGRSQEPYACNLELVGQFQGEGAKYQYTWHGDCGYYGTVNNPEQEHLGVVVVDASDVANPVASAYLTEPAMLDPHESLKVHQARRLLAGVETGGPGFAIYDVGFDCANPLLLASVDFPGVEGHAGNFAQDGFTYYGAAIFGRGDSRIYAIDVRNPADPQRVSSPGAFPIGTHDLSSSADGNRVYLARPGNVPQLGIDDPNGLVVLDTTQIQQRMPDPEVPVISETYFEDGAIAQHTTPVTIGGHPYMLFVDEGASGLGTGQDFCDRGLPAFAMARLFDMADETNPTVVSKMMLEIHEPENCQVALDDAEEGDTFIYDAHYCNFDDVDDAQLLACSHFGSGLRVFDVRDPYRPKELAYYIPPAQFGKKDELPASQHALRAEKLTQDWVSAHVRLLVDRGEVWTTSHDNGFMVLRFTNGVLDQFQ